MFSHESLLKFMHFIHFIHFFKFWNLEALFQLKLNPQFLRSLKSWQGYEFLAQVRLGKHCYKVELRVGFRHFQGDHGGEFCSINLQFLNLVENIYRPLWFFKVCNSYSINSKTCDVTNVFSIGLCLDNLYLSRYYLVLDYITS